MTTTLADFRILLSKEIGDYWAGTTTSSGSSTTVVDTALKAKNNDWISDAPQEHYDLLTSGTYSGEERKISSLDNTSGTLTTLAHGGVVASAVGYEVHRLFTASEKRTALIFAAKMAFPAIFKKIRNITLTVDDSIIGTGIDISTLGLFNGVPHRISEAPEADSTDEYWYTLRNWHVESDGKLYLKEGTTGYYLKIEGIGYLDFVTTGTTTVSDAWTAVMDISSPQTFILVAEAIVYLYTQLSMPNFTTGDRKEFAPILEFWAKMMDYRKSKFKMMPPAATIQYGGIW